MDVSLPIDPISIAATYSSIHTSSNNPTILETHQKESDSQPLETTPSPPIPQAKSQSQQSMPSLPQPAAHVNPYCPHRRRVFQSRMAKFTISLADKECTQDPAPPPVLPPTSLPKSIPPPDGSNPYSKPISDPHHHLNTQALRQCSTMSSASSSTERSADKEIAQLYNKDDISVRRTRHRLVYKPDRLNYTTLGDSTPLPPPPLLPGLNHLSSLESSMSLSTLQEIINIQAQLHECAKESNQLIGLLTFTSSSSTSHITPPPIHEIKLPLPPPQTLLNETSSTSNTNNFKYGETSSLHGEIDNDNFSNMTSSKGDVLALCTFIA